MPLFPYAPVDPTLASDLASCDRWMYLIAGTGMLACLLVLGLSVAIMVKPSLTGRVLSLAGSLGVLALACLIATLLIDNATAPVRHSLQAQRTANADTIAATYRVDAPSQDELSTPSFTVRKDGNIIGRHCVIQAMNESPAYAIVVCDGNTVLPVQH